MLISGLYLSGNEKMLRRARALAESGVRMVALLAQGDDTPGYDHSVAAAYAGLGIATFACTPGHFPDLMTTAIGGGDLAAWAAARGIALARGEKKQEELSSFHL